MKTLAFSIQKGGVGKTTISGSVGFIAGRKVKTLLVDADPQGSLTSWILTDPLQVELADVLQGRADLKDALINITDKLYLLGTFGIGGGLLQYGQEGLERKPYVFQELRRRATELGFKLVIFDTHPGSNRLERSVLLGSSEVITPITPEYLSIDGIEIFRDFLENDVRKGYRGLVRYEKIVLNLINKSFRRHDAYRQKVQTLGYQFFEISQDAKLAEAQIHHQSILDYAPRSRVIPQLEALTNAILN